MRTAIALLAIIMGCTPMHKEFKTQTVYHQECKEQVIDMGTINKPICATRYEHTVIITEKPVENE